MKRILTAAALLLVVAACNKDENYNDKYGDRELNRRAPGPLRLWCGKLALNRDCPLADYRGQIFAAPPPEWWDLK